jgi:hypothetical protein
MVRLGSKSKQPAQKKKSVRGTQPLAPFSATLRSKRCADDFPAFEVCLRPVLSTGDDTIIELVGVLFLVYIAHIREIEILFIRIFKPLEHNKSVIQIFSLISTLSPIYSSSFPGSISRALNQHPCPPLHTPPSPVSAVAHPPPHTTITPTFGSPRHRYRGAPRPTLARTAFPRCPAGGALAVAPSRTPPSPSRLPPLTLPSPATQTL